MLGQAVTLSSPTRMAAPSEAGHERALPSVVQGAEPDPEAPAVGKGMGKLKSSLRETGVE